MIQNLKKIPAPIDFSEYSMEALRGAVELAKDLDGEVHIAHVVAPHFALLDKPREQARETVMLEEAEEEHGPASSIYRASNDRKRSREAGALRAVPVMVFRRKS